MKTVRTLILVNLVILFSLFPSVSRAESGFPVLGQTIPAPEQASAANVLLIWQNDTGAQLYAQNENEMFSPVGGNVALMTAKIASDMLQMEDIVLVDDTIDTLDSNSRKIGLREGDRLSVRDLLSCMLLYGAQDAAVVLAKAAAGSTELFVQMMNEQALSLGMKDTHYVNPTGAYSPEQVTTATDMMLLASAVQSSQELMQVLSLSEYTIESDTANIDGTIENRCALMLPDESAYDERIKGAAIGSTTDTGTVAAFFAEYGNSDVILILTSDNTIEDFNENVKKLLDYSYTFETLDIKPLVQLIASGMTYNSGMTTIDGFDVTKEARIIFSAYPGFKDQFDVKKLKLEIYESLVQDVQLEKPAALAILFYNEEALTGVELLPLNIITSTPEPEATPVPVDEEALQAAPEPVKSSGIGWLTWTAAAAVLAIAVVIIGRSIRKRMR